MEDQEDDVERVIDEAAKAKSYAIQSARATYAKMIIGCNEILKDRICPKCGYEASTRKYISPEDYYRAVEHISYVCLCGNHWEGKTLDQLVAEANP
jgi:hypothetical protein